MNGVVAGDHHQIVYRFHSPDGEVREFLINLRRPGLLLVGDTSQDPLPAWTALGHHQCANCPLDSSMHSHCPIAVNLVPVIEAFAHVLSHDESDVVVITPSRTYSARTKNTLALGSLIGIYMAASGCPIMDKLRPMVLTHTPFSTTEESIYRSMATYLMGQYFLHRRSGTGDWSLENFPDFFEQVDTVNRHFVKRITTVVEKDASLNALVLLNCFASATRRAITQERFDEFEEMFSAYFAGETMRQT